jgi:glycine cleavage system H lipoate-binding protein
MESKDRPAHGSVIPLGERRCIWMDAGVISLKICDRDLDCDGCPLDRALRGDDRGKADRFDKSALPAALVPLSKFSVDTSLYYHPGHTWMRMEKPGRVRVGLAPILSQILGSVDALSSQRLGGTITRDVAFGELIQSERCFPILSPLSGEVVEINRELERRPNLALFDPLGRGWIVEVAPSSFEPDAARCRTGKAVFAWILQRLDWLKEYAATDLAAGSSRLGPTAHDGGELRTDLRGILPPERYRRLVLALLGADDEWSLEP